MKKKQIISFPHMGDYHIVIRSLLQNLFPHHEIRSAPPITKKTSALGEKHSPEAICEPFKYNMGNYMEALENGATILLQTGTGCRYGYYSVLQEEILKNLGYEFTFLHLSRKNAYPLAAYKTLKAAGMQCSLFSTARYSIRAVYSIFILDKYADFLRKHQWKSAWKKHLDKQYHNLLLELENVESVLDIFKLDRKYKKQCKKVIGNEKNAPIKIGIVGDLYTVMEPFANGNMEAFFLDRNIEIHRKMSVSFLLLGKRKASLLRKTKPYLSHHIGANGTDSVYQSLQYAKKNLDGIIQVKAFGCTPEINAMPALQKIAKDFQIPLLQLSFDIHQSEVGLLTRLEAFCDMLEMKRSTQDEEKSQFRNRYWFHFNKRGGVRP